MRQSNAQGLPIPAQDFECDAAHALAVETTESNSEETRSTKPFIERRRRASLQTAWPEALDAIQQQLIGYELAQQKLLESESSYRSIFESSPIGIFQALPNGELLSLNPEMARILGFESAAHYLSAAEDDVSLRFFDLDKLHRTDSSVFERGDSSSVDLLIRCAQGTLKWVRINLRAMRGNKQITHFEGTAEDVTAQKDAEMRTELLAYYDLLTGLPNRTHFQNKVNNAIGRLDRASGRLALFILEFDSYKSISESFGELFSDTLLQEIAKRIGTEVGDKGIIARLGGAEFGIVMENCQGSGHIAEIAASILASLSADYSLLGQTLSIFFSMGIGVRSENGEDFETLLKNAEVARSFARVEGLSNFKFFTVEMNDQLQERLRVESSLRMALARNEFHLEYQPQVDLRTGAVVGVEALLRWMSPQLGPVPPASFIEIAEKSGLIVPIGEWVLQAACSQARSWQDSDLPPVPIAVNVSPVQFRQQNFCEVVQRALSDTRLSPKYLELELTESLLMSNADHTSSTISELKNMGVMLSIDDFGTGYSSFGYLRQFKFQRLKIARSFIQEVPTNPDHAAITIAIIDMARAMNLSVLAEGVETEDQLLFLRAQNCQSIQGYYFSKPVPAGELDGQLRRGFSDLIPAVAEQPYSFPPDAAA